MTSEEENRMTRITIDLPDDLAAALREGDPEDLIPDGTARLVLWGLARAALPRPITPGDRVVRRGVENARPATVEHVTEDGWAWIRWDEGFGFDTYRATDLERL